MEQQKNPNEDFNTNKSRAGEGATGNDMGKEQRPEGGKEKGNPENSATHDEGQYQEGSDKATMSPGSSESEVNPSAMDKLEGNK